MPKLNILRPHRRTAPSQSPNPTADSAAKRQRPPSPQLAAPVASYAPSPQFQNVPQATPISSLDNIAIPASAPSAPSAASLPPLNFGSPGLGAEGFLTSTFLTAPITTTSVAVLPPSSKPTITRTAPSPPAPLTKVSSNSLLTHKALPPPPPAAPAGPRTPSPLQASQQVNSTSPGNSGSSRPGTGKSATSVKNANGTIIIPLPPSPPVGSVHVDPSINYLQSASHTPHITHTFATHGKEKEKEKDHSHKRNAKLNLLNPMSLLLRRRTSHQSGLLADGSSSRKFGTRDLPDDFDPGIIYGTRHPDWSSPSPRNKPVQVQMSRSPKPNVRVPTPLRVQENEDTSATAEKQRTPAFKECFDQQPQLPPLSQGQAPPAAERGPTPPPKYSVELLSLEPTPVPAKSASAAVAASTKIRETELSREYSFTKGDEAIASEGYSGMRVPVKKARIAPRTSSSSESSTSSEEYGAPFATLNEMNNKEGKPQSRGITLFDHPLSLPRHLMNNSSRFSFEGSSAAGSSHASHDDLAPDPPDTPGVNDGRLVLDTDVNVLTPNDSPFVDGAASSGLGIYNSGVTPTKGPNRAKSSGKAAFPSRQTPRWTSNDLDDDLVDMTAYENEDDEFYYDDGVILAEENDGFSKELPYQPSLLPDGMQKEADMAKELQQRLSLVTHDDVTQVPQIVSPRADVELSSPASPTSATNSPATISTNMSGNISYPPFMNPVGGGLGYQQQLDQFYSRRGTRLDMNGSPLALQTLTHSLCRYQQQQIEAQAALGRNDEFKERGFDDYELGGYDDDVPAEDDPMVAAANAEVLQSDTDGFYGREFGFYAASDGLNGSQLIAGGYFGELPRPPALLRRPSLTPISERSESSYRNSMVFGLTTADMAGIPGSRQGNSPHPLSAGIAGAQNGDEIILSQLLKMRRNTWDSTSQASSLKSAPGSGAASPVHFNPPGAGFYSNTQGPNDSIPNTPVTLAGAGSGLTTPYDMHSYGMSLGSAVGLSQGFTASGNSSTGPGFIQRQLNELNQSLLGQVPLGYLQPELRSQRPSISGMVPPVPPLPLLPQTLQGHVVIGDGNVELKHYEAEYDPNEYEAEEGEGEAPNEFENVEGDHGYGGGGNGIVDELNGDNVEGEEDVPFAGVNDIGYLEPTKTQAKAQAQGQRLPPLQSGENEASKPSPNSHNLQYQQQEEVYMNTSPINTSPASKSPSRLPSTKTQDSSYASGLGSPNLTNLTALKPDYLTQAVPVLEGGMLPEQKQEKAATAIVTTHKRTASSASVLSSEPGEGEIAAYGTGEALGGGSAGGVSGIGTRSRVKRVVKAGSGGTTGARRVERWE